MKEVPESTVGGRLEQLLLDTLLDRCRELGLIRERGRQRTDSTHVLAAVRMLNRLERVGETMRAAWNDLAVMAPDWLQALAPPEWYQCYGRRVENYHLPKTDTAREELARVVAADGEKLLAAVDAATDQPVLAQIPAVVTLRRVWAEQYTGEPGQLRWRAVKDMPSPASLWLVRKVMSVEAEVPKHGRSSATTPDRPGSPSTRRRSAYRAGPHRAGRSCSIDCTSASSTRTRPGSAPARKAATSPRSSGPRRPPPTRGSGPPCACCRRPRRRPPVRSTPSAVLPGTRPNTSCRSSR